ncbi:tetratricopeptide repeat protein [Methylomarinum vadi]|uniref:tetratricopeptide repeat protein n=1 Tax=Methylomarinum vadi TaxID=438855 RepID=UPI0004DF23CB|nr:tetratricopeptide repeat protein [Methylomarinum vadi]
MKRFLSLIVFCCIVQIGYAADNDKPATVSPWLYKKLTKTEKLIAEKSYQAAEKNLYSLLKKVDQGGYEHATVLRSLSSVQALQGHYRKAAELLEQCLALKVLPEQQQQQSILNLGQLYMATEQYRRAVETLQPWLAKNPKLDAELSALLANAYAQLKKYRQALPHIKRAIATSKKPVESWYQLELALHYELNEYAAAAKLLRQLIQQYPNKKEYWEQLSSVYQQLKQFKKAVTIQHLAYKKGLLNSEKEILALTNLFLYTGSPYRGAKLLSDALANRQVRGNSRNWETLANAWQQARELDKAIDALEKASSLNDKGVLYQQLGQIYVEQEHWDKAVQAFNKAIAKGGLKHAGSVYLLLGMSHYELHNVKQARSAFNTAKKYGKQKKAALQWLDYLDNAS